MAIDLDHKFHITDSKSGKVVYTTNNLDEAGTHADKLTNGGGIPHVVSEALFVTGKATTILRKPIIARNVEVEPRKVIRVGEPIIDPSVEMVDGGKCNVGYDDIPSLNS